MAGQEDMKPNVMSAAKHRAFVQRLAIKSLESARALDPLIAQILDARKGGTVAWRPLRICFDAAISGLDVVSCIPLLDAFCFVHRTRLHS